jgi:hypothetical protein
MIFLSFDCSVVSSSSLMGWRSEAKMVYSSGFMAGSYPTVG